MASVSLPHVPLPVKSEIRPHGNPPMPVSRSTGVRLSQGCGGGNSAALVSAWLPKRTRIESIADSSNGSCIFFDRLREDAGSSGGDSDNIEQMFVSQGLAIFFICRGL